MSLTSDEVNYLIYRYLLESGFIHSGFTFGHESLVTRSNIDGSNVPPGALISFIQKGLQYSEIECHLGDDGTETVCDAAFSVITPHQCQQQARRRVFPVPVPGSALDSDFGVLEASYARLVRVSGHADMVTRCAWSPKDGVLATASADSTARLWEVGASGGVLNSSDAKDDAEMTTSNTRPSDFFKTVSGAKVVLRPKSLDPTSNNRSVTALEWSPSGAQVAIGAFDGRAFIWNSTGELRRSLDHHRAAVSVLRWNPSGDLLVTGGVDRTVVLWDVASGQVRANFQCHKGPIVDLDWRNQGMFASCSTDGLVCVFVAGQSEPVLRIRAHKRDVNSVRWCPATLSGQGPSPVLASASDDGTVRLWDVDDGGREIHCLSGHEREVTLVRWAPGGSRIASSSLDTTVRIWDPETGKQVQMLNRHLHPVTALAYNHDGSLLASAAHDRVHVWNTRDGQLVTTYRAEGGVNDISWDATGTQLALALSNATCVAWRVNGATE